MVAKVIARERPDAVLRPSGGRRRSISPWSSRSRHAPAVRRRADRRLGRGHPDRRRPAEVPRRDGVDRRGRAEERPGGLARRRAAPRRRDRLPVIIGRRSRSAASAAAWPTTWRNCATSPSAASTRARARGPHRGIGPRLEGVRARGHARSADNFVVICSIENVDPMGVHTGDSITVAPALTLTDKEYQRMRDAGGASSARRRRDRRSNIQFAVHPQDGRMVAIEMTRACRARPRSPRGHGFPIAKIAAKLRLGYHSTRSRTTSRASPPPPSSRPSTTSSSRCRDGRSRSSRRPTGP